MRKSALTNVGDRGMPTPVDVRHKMRALRFCLEVLFGDRLGPQACMYLLSARASINAFPCEDKYMCLWGALALLTPLNLGTSNRGL